MFWGQNWLDRLLHELAVQWCAQKRVLGPNWLDGLLPEHAGWDEIIRLKEQLEGLACFRSQRYQLLPLHSMVPSQDQRKVFIRPPPGVRKLILATNIAETAVTIDDIVCVINSGRLPIHSWVWVYV